MVTVTPAAAQAVKWIMEQQKAPHAALRVGVKGGGCSGFTYVLAIDEATPKQYDMAFEQDGVKVLIDAKSHLYLDGMTIDYKNSLVGGGFEFQNPLAKKSCGCGTSFAV